MMQAPGYIPAYEHSQPELFIGNLSGCDGSLLLVSFDIPGGYYATSRFMASSGGNVCSYRRSNFFPNAGMTDSYYRDISLVLDAAHRGGIEVACGMIVTGSSGNVYRVFEDTVSREGIAKLLGSGTSVKDGFSTWLAAARGLDARIAGASYMKRIGETCIEFPFDAYEGRNHYFYQVRGYRAMETALSRLRMLNPRIFVPRCGEPLPDWSMELKVLEG